jgi:hypothetical protein
MVRLRDSAILSEDHPLDCRGSRRSEATRRHAWAAPTNLGRFEVAPELTGQGLALGKCEAYDRPYDQHLGSR